MAWDVVQPGEVEVLLPPLERHQEDEDARESVDQHVRSGEVAAALAICKFVSDSYVLFKQDSLYCKIRINPLIQCYIDPVWNPLSLKTH